MQLHPSRHNGQTHLCVNSPPSPAAVLSSRHPHHHQSYQKCRKSLFLPSLFHPLPLKKEKWLKLKACWCVFLLQWESLALAGERADMRVSGRLLQTVLTAQIRDGGKNISMRTTLLGHLVTRHNLLHKKRERKRADF